ncbi:MAG TPA: hypothetical protein VKN99_25245 [Polyangia bacterium]|nr:hypothetical protein [Polyangia bacterium]
MRPLFVAALVLFQQPAKTPAPAPAAPAPGKGLESEAGHNKMMHCPSAVAGAKTAIKNTKDGVELTVTGKGEAAKEILTRAKHLAEVSKAAATGKHTGEGTAGGAEGHCPVVMKDTMVSATETKGGAKISIKPEKADGDVKALQKMVKQRQDALPGLLKAAK